jgi:hypothetical protein
MLGSDPTQFVATPAFEPQLAQMAGLPIALAQSIDALALIDLHAI